MLVRKFTNTVVISITLMTYVLKSFFEEHCARIICLMESYDIKNWMPFCDQGDRSMGREKDHDLVVSRTFTFDDTLLDKYDTRHVECLLMHISPDRHWHIYEARCNNWIVSLAQICLIVWFGCGFYKSSYCLTQLVHMAFSWKVKLAPKLILSLTNIPLSNHNTSCNRGDCCMYSCSDASPKDPQMQTSYCRCSKERPLKLWLFWNHAHSYLVRQTLWVKCVP